jgi:hypothetical protein
LKGVRLCVCVREREKHPDDYSHIRYNQADA